MPPVLLIIFGFTFIFFMTSFGASIIFLFKKPISPKFSSFILGLASGIMLSASVWSLLLPALSLSQNLGAFKVLPATLGLTLGSFFVIALDKFIPTPNGAFYENKNKKFKKLFVAITLHNIPEVLSVGFVFGLASISPESTAMASALALAVGIGLQNAPEGLAISLAYKGIGGKRLKAFLLGTLSGAIEPICAVAGFFLASLLSIIQPWLLAFSAGAMIFVVTQELIPDSKNATHPHIGSLGFMAGFIIMMMLDVCL